MKNFDNAEFLTELKRRPWGTTHAPVKKKWVRSDQLPWISTEIQHEIARRNWLFKRYRKNPTNNLWVAYKQQRK